MNTYLEVAVVGFTLVCLLGCEPEVESDEVIAPQAEDIEAPSNSQQAKDYAAYSEEVCVKSPVSLSQTVSESSSSGKTTHEKANSEVKLQQ